MIIFSIGCTLRLIASVVDQISKNPIVIFRDDTPIDITKVSTKWKYNIYVVKCFDSKQIPFPAFTVCELDNASYADVNIEINFMEFIDTPIYVISTEYGKCRVANFLDPKAFFHSKADEKQFFEYVELDDDTDEDLKYNGSFPENQTTPYKTSSFELGFDITVYNGRYDKAFVDQDSKPFILMIHSPFGLPTKDSQRFYFADMSHDAIFITPQLNTIDDTMIGMKPKL